MRRRLQDDGGGALPPTDRRPAEARTEAAERRARILERADRLYEHGLSRGRADAQAAQEAGASKPSIARWRRAVRGLDEGRLQALEDRPGRGRRPALTVEALGLLESLVVAEGPHLTAEHARRTLAARGHRAPSARTVARWIEQVRRDRARALSAIEHPDRHRSRRQPAYGDRGAAATGLNALWELDSSPADVLCADGRRYAVVGAIDVWSRRAALLVTPTSRATAVAALLRRCLLAWGVPGLVRTDGGADYTSVHVRRVLADLHVRHEQCPPYTPEAKPYIERFFKSVATDLWAHLPGFAGHDVAQREALRARRSMSARRGRDDAAVMRASMTAEDLQRRCDEWCQALYAHRVHGETGRTPFEAGAAWTGEVRRVEDVRGLDVLLAESPGSRVISKRGTVQVDGGEYVAVELGARVGERVLVRRDPGDYGQVWLFAADGQYVASAVDVARLGVDRAEMAGRMKALHREADRQGRQWGRELRRQHRPERAMLDVLDAARGRADRVVALPGRGWTPHETPALDAASAAAAGDGARQRGRRKKASGERPRDRTLDAARKLYLRD